MTAKSLERLLNRAKKLELCLIPERASLVLTTQDLALQAHHKLKLQEYHLEYKEIMENIAEVYRKAREQQYGN